jgi:hypothetical protein
MARIGQDNTMSPFWSHVNLKLGTNSEAWTAARRRSMKTHSYTNDKVKQDVLAKTGIASQKYAGFISQDNLLGISRVLVFGGRRQFCRVELVKASENAA